MILLALFACGSVGLDQQKPGAGTTAAGVTLTDVSPGWGPPDAETAVTLTGTGFEGTVTAWFGNAEVSVSRVDANTLVATAPAAGVEATVDVVVRSDLGEATLPGGFTYSVEPIEETDADTDADSDSDADADADTDTAAGQVGGLVQFTLLQVACPSCLGYTDSLLVEATAGFHRPTSASWVDWLPREGSCVVNPSPAAAASTFLDGGEWLYLTSGSTSCTPCAAGSFKLFLLALEQELSQPRRQLLTKQAQRQQFCLQQEEEEDQQAFAYRLQALALLY